MGVIGKYPAFYTNYKGELVKRLPDSQLPRIGIDFPNYSKVKPSQKVKKRQKNEEQNTEY